MDTEFIKAALRALVALVSRVGIPKNPRDRMFDDTIRPLYEAVEPIAGEYLNLFQSLRNEITQSRPIAEVREAMCKFKRDREEVVFARSKVPFGNLAKNAESQVRAYKTIAHQVLRG
jgi:hypothetical protein